MKQRDLAESQQSCSHRSPLPTQKGTYTQYSNPHSGRASANATSSSGNDIDGDFPFDNGQYPYHSDSYSVTAIVSEASSSSVVTAGVALLLVTTSLDLFGEKLPVTALIDSGSTHSFISPRVLSSLQLSEAAKLP